MLCRDPDDLSTAETVNQVTPQFGLQIDVNKDVHEMSTNFGDQFKSVRKKQPKQFNPFPACSKSLFCVTSGWVSKIA